MYLIILLFLDNFFMRCTMKRTMSRMNCNKVMKKELMVVVLVWYYIIFLVEVIIGLFLRLL